MPVTSSAPLFPPELLEAVRPLRVLARRVPPRGRHAEHHAREPGSGVEFRDYRSYAAGDDLRRIDWNLFRRFGRLFLRLADESRDLPLYLLVDVSRSTWMESPPRAFAGRQVAGLLAAISLSGHDPVGIFGFGAQLGEALPPTSGGHALPRALEYLEKLGDLGTTNFQASLETFAALSLRSGLVTIVSDFFDPAGLDAVGKALAPLRHKLLFVRLLRATDRDPPFSGDLRLKDCESGTVLDVTVDAAALHRYQEAFANFESGLNRLADQFHAGILAIDTDQPVLPQLEPLFSEGVFQP